MRTIAGSASIVLLGFGQSVSGYQSPAIGIALMVVGAILGIYFLFSYKGSRRPSASVDELPLLNRLKLKLKDGLALIPKLDPTSPMLDMLKRARAWQVEVYTMLASERQDLAQRFLDATDPIEEREAQSLVTVNVAHLILKQHTSCLEEIIQELERTRSLAAARKRGLQVPLRSWRS